MVFEDLNITTSATKQIAIRFTESEITFIDDVVSETKSTRQEVVRKIVQKYRREKT